MNINIYVQFGKERKLDEEDDEDDSNDELMEGKEEVRATYDPSRNKSGNKTRPNDNVISDRNREMYDGEGMAFSLLKTSYIQRNTCELTHIVDSLTFDLFVSTQMMIEVKVKKVYLKMMKFKILPHKHVENLKFMQGQLLSYQRFLNPHESRGLIHLRLIRPLQYNIYVKDQLMKDLCYI